MFINKTFGFTVYRKKLCALSFLLLLSVFCNYNGKWKCCCVVENLFVVYCKPVHSFNCIFSVFQKLF